MKQLYILHIGVGNVGKEVVRQIEGQKNSIKKIFGIELIYKQTFTSHNSAQEVITAIDNAPIPFVLIDTTASDMTTPLLQYALQRGGFAVLANKKPLAGKQGDFDLLHTLGGQRLLYECVVGAGLPVIRPLKDLLMTGDEIVEIQGCFSGTLGFILSELDEGKLFSKSVLKAKEKGFTEPDPRDDLSGTDVARKTLILARLMGRKIELSDITLTSLYPADMQHISIEEFLKQVTKLDSSYKERVEKAKKEHKVLRFIANISEKACHVGLQAVDNTTDIGRLSGPDNIIVIKTKRYFNNPLIIKGPGAGIAVTASGVFADILSIAKIIGAQGI